MNSAHWHLAVNHFPIVGTIFGLGVLLAGIYFKNKAVKNTSYVMFIIAAVLAGVSMATGEGAEEIVEELNISHSIIHKHEELAEKFALTLYILGVLSIVALILNLKNNAKEKFILYLIIIVSIIALILAKETGTSGGEIRHIEIRDNYSLNNTNKISPSKEKEHYEDD